MPASDRRLRIAFVVHDYNRHMGHSRYVAELASRFKVDHEVHVFANTFDEPDPVESPTTTSRRGARMPWRVSSRSFCRPQRWFAGDSTSSTPRVCAGSGTTWQPLTSASRGGTMLSSGRTVRVTWRLSLSRVLITPLERLALAKRSTRRVIAISDLMRRDLARFFRAGRWRPGLYHGVDSELFHPSNRMLCRDRLRSELGELLASAWRYSWGTCKKGRRRRSGRPLG